MSIPKEIEHHSLPDIFRASAARYATHRAVVFGGRTLDFATFDRLSDRVAAGLVQQGISPGDRIGLYCINSDAFALAYFGIVKAGATVVPVNLLLNPKEVAFILGDAGAKGLFYYEAFGEATLSIRKALEGPAFCVCIGNNQAAPEDSLFERYLSCTAPLPEISVNPDEDLVAILYTSGTTGRPKGAMLTHRNLAANTWSIKEALQLTPGQDVFLVVLPLFHAFAATVGMLFPLLYGCTFVPVPRFEPEQVARLIESEKVTIFFGVPSMFNLLLRLPDDHVARFASLRYAVSGGAAMPVEIMKRFEERFGKLLYEGDGPTECSPVTCVNPIGGQRKPASVGLPVPLVEMKIVDEEGRELPHGQIGEICVRGPNVMKGYWHLPEDTKQSFFGEWFRTGDLGTEDDDGYFFIVDRKKDMIIVNGMNVYPRIIEEVLYRYEPIREAAVVGELHGLHGEIPVAYLSLKPGAETTPEKVRAYCRDNLGRHEIPRKVLFLPDLPKNAAGKILKRELRKQGELERGIDSRNEEPRGTP